MPSVRFLTPSTLFVVSLTLSSVLFSRISSSLAVSTWCFSMSELLLGFISSRSKSVLIVVTVPCSTFGIPMFPLFSVTPLLLFLPSVTPSFLSISVSASFVTTKSSVCFFSVASPSYFSFSDLLLSSTSSRSRSESKVSTVAIGAFNSFSCSIASVRVTSLS